MAEPTVPPPPPHDPDRPLGTPPPVAAPPAGGASPWGKIALFGCLGLLLLAILLGLGGFFAYRYFKGREDGLTERTLEERQERGGGSTSGDSELTSEPRQIVEGTLDSGDHLRDDGSYYEVKTITVPPGARLIVTLRSTDFDAYLTVHSPGGTTYSDDDAGGGTDSRVEIPSTEGGDYRIWANSLRAGATGDYTLTIERSP